LEFTGGRGFLGAADLVVALGLVRVFAVLVFVAFDALVALADGGERVFAVQSVYALDAVVFVFADGRERVFAVGVDETNLTVFAVADGLCCATIAVLEALDAVFGGDVAERFAWVFAVEV